MSNDTFAAICFGIVLLWPLSWLVLITIYRKDLVRINTATTAPADISEFYRRQEQVIDMES